LGKSPLLTGATFHRSYGPGMKITFRLRFYTHFGQSLFLCGNHEALGVGKIENAIPLRYLDSEFWEATIEIPSPPDKKFSYRYILRNPNGSMIEDWEDSRAINPASLASGNVLVIDSWNDMGAAQNVFYTEPFKNVLLKNEQTGVSETAPQNSTHTFKVKAPLLKQGETLCILGGGEALGNWSTQSPRLLNLTPGEDFLTARLDLSKERFPVEYKYGVYSVEQARFVHYEEGENRVLRAEAKQSAADLQSADIAQIPGRSSADYKSAAPSGNLHILVNDGFVRLPATTWRGAGLAIPVFSLRSEKSFGVGEFADLKLLVDWGSKIGLKLIQILPINDSTATHTWLDSYPYAATSAFALHPLYLNLNSIASDANKPLLKKLEPERKRLNALEALDYEAVMKAKLSFIREIFPSQKTETFSSAEYREFFEKNKHWLKPYAAFSYLRDKFGSPDFNQWPAFRTYNAEEVEALAANDWSAGLRPGESKAVSETGRVGDPRSACDEIELHYFIQFHLHTQLRGAVEYAHARGLILKGDLAIGVSRLSADVWQYPELFNPDLQAGAPPDPFSDKGQNWGFPTYNWPRMKQDGFAWWRRRFEQMSAYFDAFRIDHILGFFRIWSIPAHAVEGILGYFVPAIPLRIEEFQQREIPFHRERYVKPLINDEVLSEIFGGDAEHVKREFLNSENLGHYSLKPEFATQRRVEKYFTAKTTSPSPATKERERDGVRVGLENAPNKIVSSSPQPSPPLHGGEGESTAKLKAGLFDLISNVILIEAESADGPEYHFRFFMDRTTSFKFLDPQTQSQLRDLYVDYFFRRQDAFWANEAMQKLPAFKRCTNMLICGEDLGLVPDCVPDVMKHLGILSLEVQRMPKQMNRDFSRPAEAPYLSVVTPSTHDMSTIRGWWEEDRNATQKFYSTELGLPGDAPQICTGALNEAVIAQHLASPAMWSIFQLQDLLGVDEQLRHPNPAAERINVPANPKNYWQYRMHLSLERLQSSERFNNRLRDLIGNSGR
jgi:4-alpha-glucanotransferase